MLGLVAASLAAGALTVLAPCVLPVLPVIVGGSLDARAGERWRPFVVAGSLVASLVAFTLLLRASTVALGVQPWVWSLLSGGLLVGLGAAKLVPGAWARASAALRLDSGSHVFLGRARGVRGRVASAVLVGAALGPVFSSCSPTYLWVVATVVPAEVLPGLVLLGSYCAGLAAVLLAIALAGRRLVDKLGWAVDPSGPFARALGVVLIVVGVAVLTGADRALQTWLVDAFGSATVGP